MDHRSGAAEILSGGLARVFSKPGQPEEREMYSFPVPEVKSLKVSTFERRNYEVSESIVWWVLDKTSVYLPSGGIHILELVVVYIYWNGAPPLPPRPCP